jgi:CBS domain-containing protein
MKVEQLMSREPKTCTPAESLNRAAQLMWENDFGCVPVVEKDSKVVAMLTDRDICIAAYTQGATLHAMQVSSAMSREVFVCRLDDDLAAAQKLMGDRRVRRLPVLAANGKLVGIISLNDIARAAQRDGSAKPAVADTVAAICAPRLKTQLRTKRKGP